MESLHEAASQHLPPFITAPGETDWLLVVMAIVLLGSLVALGAFFFWLHNLPERMVHHKIQFDLVASLALLGLLTHIHAFWVAAFIIALIDFPDISLPDFFRSVRGMAGSLETIAEAQTQATGEKSLPPGPPPSAVPRPLPSAQAKADVPGSDQANEPARKREAGHA